MKHSVKYLILPGLLAMGCESRVEAPINETVTVFLSPEESIRTDEIWPEAENEGLHGDYPVAVFSFYVEDVGDYQLDAMADRDVVLILLYEDIGSLEFIEYDDDGGDGFNSCICERLVPGNYIALVAFYDSDVQGDIRFRWRFD